MKSSNKSSLLFRIVLVGAVARTGLFAAGNDIGNMAPPQASVATGAAGANEEIAQLRTLLAAQQKQLETLQNAITQQQELLRRALDSSGSGGTVLPIPGGVASMTPVASAPAAQSPIKAPPVSPDSTSVNLCEAGIEAVTPPYLRLGSVCIVPVGFMDLTGVWRNENAASGIGSNFASVPYNNTAAARLSEFRFSPQNSRIGFRIDGDWKGAHFIGYNEFDFLGTSGSNAIGIANGGFAPRLRLFWVDVRRNKFEMLAGQSWSMLTPNRSGISALPGDLFYSQAIDVNYIIGLTWTRQPGVRLLYHPNDKIAFGLSLENPDQQIGGNAGAALLTLPAASALSGIGGNQADNATNVLNTPNVNPDIIAKVAFDPASRVHFEVAGIERTFRIWDSATNSYSTVAGGGLQVGLNAEVLTGVRLISTNFLSDGGARYMLGQAPDFVVRANGAISPIHANGSVNGVEATLKNTLLFGYYGLAYFGRNVSIDANGASLIGYGYSGSANSQNRDIQEITLGFNRTLWKSPRYGALNYIMQYEYALRDPWFVAAGALRKAHDSTIYGDFRYTLPGSMPKI